MYTTSKLSLTSRDYIANLPGKISKTPELLTFALSRVIASKLPFPTAAVVTPGTAYTNTAAVGARELVSLFSDLFPFNTQDVLALTRTMWLVRYKAAFTSDVIYSSPEDSPEAAFFGYGSVLSKIEVKFIDDYYSNLLPIYNALSVVYKELVGVEVAYTGE
jgi:hypothetical protein